MKWIIDGLEYTDAENVARYIVENMDCTDYDEILNECYDTITIAGIDFYPAEILYKCDPIAYRCGMADYYDGLTDDIKYTVDCMDGGESEEIYSFTVDCVDDETGEK